jgi:hypothetical protein
MPTPSQKRQLAMATHVLKPQPVGTTNWRAAKSLLALRKQVNDQWPDRLKASDGIIGDAEHATRDSDHNPWVKDGAMGVVTAIDITHDPAHGMDAQKVVDALVASRDPRIKYIIWSKQILSATVKPWTWRPYTGKNPHTKHFHLSVSANKSLYDDVSPWRIL